MHKKKNCLNAGDLDPIFKVRASLMRKIMLDCLDYVGLSPDFLDYRISYRTDYVHMTLGSFKRSK